MLNSIKIIFEFLNLELREKLENRKLIHEKYLILVNIFLFTVYRFIQVEVDNWHSTWKKLLAVQQLSSIQDRI